VKVFFFWLFVLICAYHTAGGDDAKFTTLSFYQLSSFSFYIDQHVAEVLVVIMWNISFTCLET